MHMHLFLLHIEEHAITAFYTFFLRVLHSIPYGSLEPTNNTSTSRTNFSYRSKKKFAHMSMKYSHFRLLLLFSLASSHCHPNHHLLHWVILRFPITSSKRKPTVDTRLMASICSSWPWRPNVGAKIPPGDLLFSTLFADFIWSPNTWYA